MKPGVGQNKGQLYSQTEFLDLPSVACMLQEHPLQASVLVARVLATSGDRNHERHCDASVEKGATD